MNKNGRRTKKKLSRISTDVSVIVFKKYDV